MRSMPTRSVSVPVRPSAQPTATSARTTARARRAACAPVDAFARRGAGDHHRVEAVLRFVGDDRHALATCRQRLGGTWQVHLLHGLPAERAGHPRQMVVEHPARRVGEGGNDEGLPHELRQRHGGAVRPGVLGGHLCEHREAHDEADLQVGRTRMRGETEVGLAAGHGVGDGRGGGLHQVEYGVPRDGGQRREDVVDGGHRAGDRQARLAPLGEGAHHRHRLVVPGHQIACDGQQSGSGRADVQPPAVPYEEFAAQGRLELTNLPGQRGLGDVQGSRRRRDGPGVDHREEIADRADLHPVCLPAHLTGVCVYSTAETQRSRRLPRPAGRAWRSVAICCQ